MPTPLLLSLNVPFCPVRCAYCDKGCDVIGDLSALDRYADALTAEVKASAHQFEDCQVQAVWIGGGMAGHLFDEKLGLLLRDMRGWFPFAEQAEITLKVHPGMVSTETLTTMRRGGITRLSIDYATSNTFECEPLGRFLPPDVMDVTKMVLANTPVSLSFDVLTGLPAQTPGTIVQTLDQALRYGAQHIHLMPLRIVLGTPFADEWVKAHTDRTSLRHRLPDAEEQEAILAAAQDWLTAHGFVQYLPEQYALPGCESTYLRLEKEGCSELSFGAGAVSRLDGFVSHNIRSVRDYCRFSPAPEKLTHSVCPIE